MGSRLRKDRRWTTRGGKGTHVLMNAIKSSVN